VIPFRKRPLVDSPGHGGGFASDPTLGNGDWPDDHILDYHWANEITGLDEFIARWIAKINGDFPPDPYTVEDLFQAELEQEDWWQDHHQAYRDAEQQRVSDPGTWAENLRLAENKVRTAAKELGYEGESALTASEVTRLAVDSLHAVTGGWLEGTLKRQISRFKTDVDPSGSEDAAVLTTPMGRGTKRGSFDTYQGIAAANLISVNDDRVWKWAHQKANGTLTDEQIKQEIYDIGKNQYGFVGDDRWDRWRHSETTLSDYLNDRRVAVGDIWGITASEVNWDSQFMKDYLVFSDPDDPTKERFRTSKEMRQLAMRDPDTMEVNPRYATTLGYKTKKANFRNMIYQGFGVI